MTLHSKITPQPATSHPESYADYLALGMQKADKALPGGSVRRKEDYARSYANSRAPVEVIQGPVPVVVFTAAELANQARIAAKYASATPRRDALEHYYSEVREDDGETDPYFREAFR